MPRSPSVADLQMPDERKAEIRGLARPRAPATGRHRDDVEPERGRAFSGPPVCPFFVVIRMTPTSPSSAAANTRLPPTRRHQAQPQGPRRRVVRRGSIGTIFGPVPALFARLIVIGTTLVILSTLLHSLTAADIGLILFLLAAIGACAGARRNHRQEAAPHRRPARLVRQPLDGP